LESRLAPATITVTTTADDLTPNDGSVSLREAITAINAGTDLGDLDIKNQNPGIFGTDDAIHFNINAAGVQTINVGGTGLGPLPVLAKPLTLDGYTQPGSAVNTRTDANNATILIELNGMSAGANADGLTVAAGDTVVQGLVINRFSGNGVLVTGADGSVVTSSFIGTNAAGSVALGNGLDGVRIIGSENNGIGGPTPDQINVISGNVMDGIHLLGAAARGNIIQGNFVGLNAAGTGPVAVRPSGPLAGTLAGNFGFGIEVDGGTLNVVGGPDASVRNVVGFNAAGIELDNGAQGNIVQGNLSGVGADGVTPAGNVLHGIVLRSNLQPGEPGVQNNVIGGQLAGDGNVVAFNGTGGVAVFGNPPSGSGQQNTGNAIEGNSIFQNGRRNPGSLLGIDLVIGSAFPTDDGVTPNTAGGPTPGPNNLQNHPVLASAAAAAGGGTTISGTLNSTPNANGFRLEFFASDADPKNGVPEGQLFLGDATVNTDADGNASFSVTVPGTARAGQLVTATATDPGNNTSEFSAAVQALGPTPGPGGTPVLTGISPALAFEGGPAFTLTVTGGGFGGDSTVLLGGFPLTTTFVSDGQLQAQVPAGLLADEAAVPVAVVNAGTGLTSNAQTFFVLESLLPDGTRGTPNQRFVSELYHDLLGRPVDPLGLSVFAGLLDVGFTRTQVVGFLEGTPEYRAVVTEGLYLKLLHRPADPVGLNAVVNFLAAGGTVEQVEAFLAGSQEYFLLHGGTRGSFIDALYGDVLHRAADPPGRAAIEQALAGGTLNLTQIASVLVTSREALRVVAAEDFVRLLNHGIDAANADLIAAALLQGLRDEQLIAVIAGSPEYFGRVLP
jgi:CSLREA domain-containing protein